MCYVSLVIKGQPYFFVRAKVFVLNFSNKDINIIHLKNRYWYHINNVDIICFIFIHVLYVKINICLTFLKKINVREVGPPTLSNLLGGGSSGGMGSAAAETNFLELPYTYSIS